MALNKETIDICIKLIKELSINFSLQIEKTLDVVIAMKNEELSSDRFIHIVFTAINELIKDSVKGFLKKEDEGDRKAIERIVRKLNETIEEIKF